LYVRSWIRPLAVLAVSLLLFACGGRGGGGADAAVDEDVFDATDASDATDALHDAAFDMAEPDDGSDAADAVETTDVADAELLDTADVVDVEDTRDASDTSDLAELTDAPDVTDVVETSDVADDGCDVVDCGDPGIFDDLVFVEDARLRRLLYVRITDHIALGYGDARAYMYSELDVTDGLVECVYTGALTAADGTSAPGDFNTEHSWPQSLGASSEPARSDLHHLFPATARSNNARSNNLYGETACDQTAACGWFESGSERGASVSDGSTVFEVRPQTRGNIARAQFYFAVRYELAIEEPVETVLRSWNESDPPDERERARNEGIERVQLNRNPFVDYPEFVDRIADF
jgi:deoxyribonuclease-1